MQCSKHATVCLAVHPNCIGKDSVAKMIYRSNVYISVQQTYSCRRICTDLTLLFSAATWSAILPVQLRSASRSRTFSLPHWTKCLIVSLWWDVRTAWAGALCTDCQKQDFWSFSFMLMMEWMICLRSILGCTHWMPSEWTHWCRGNDTLQTYHRSLALVQWLFSWSWKEGSLLST